MIGISRGSMGAPRSFMFWMLSSHCPRESFARVMCCASWQVAQRIVVRSEPLPGMSVREGSGSCARSGATTAVINAAAMAAIDVNARPLTGHGSGSRRPRALARELRLDEESDAVNAVPEVPQRVPRRHDRLHVALVVGGAREHRHVARRPRRVGVAENAPGVLVAAGLERRALPGDALVERQLDFLY